MADDVGDAALRPGLALPSGVEPASAVSSTAAIPIADPNDAYNEGQSPFWYDDKGEEHCDDSFALAELLKAEVVFPNQRSYAHKRNGVWPDKPDGSTIVLYAGCNDVFAWACADAEDLPLAEVRRLYKLWTAHGGAGVDKWACLRRRQKPQPPVEQSMRKAGVWDAEMDALPSNTQDAEVQAVFAAVARGGVTEGRDAAGGSGSEASSTRSPQGDAPAHPPCDDVTST